MIIDPAAAGDRCRVLICDDRRELRDAISTVLSKVNKFDVVGQAVDGTSCLDLVRRMTPDVLILDVGMPGGGARLAARIKVLRPGTHIVVYSGIDDDQVRDGMLTAGADEYVVKTGRLRPLLDALDRASALCSPFGASQLR